MAENQRSDLAQRLLETREAVGEAVEQGLDRDPTMRNLTGDRERELFWKRAMSEEQEAQLWAQGVDPWAISAMVYPDRWKLAKAGRPKLSEQVAWFKDQKAKGPLVVAEAPVGPVAALPSPMQQPAAPPMPPQQPAALPGLEGVLPASGPGAAPNLAAAPALPAVDDDAYDLSTGG